MDQSSINKLMNYIDDPEIKETMGRITDTLDQVDRVKDQRRNPEEKNIRARDIRASLDKNLEEKVQAEAGGIALVLTGGGGKGSYQAGACKALLELPIHKEITGTAGTSVGAMNAALYAGSFSRKQPSLIESVWADIKEEGMNGREGFFSPSDENDRYLESLIRDSGVLPAINQDSILTIATAYDYEKGWPRDFILNGLSDQEKMTRLLASAAFPAALKEQEIGGSRYVDGGIPVIGSNMPIAPLYHLGWRRFIVIHCSSRTEAADWSDINKLGIRLNNEKYFNGASFLHIYAKKDLGGIMEGTANFNHDYIMANLAQGYQDMLANVKQLEILSQPRGPLEEVHILDGESYHSFTELLENL
ncbi:MAG: patatin-like phospholipase family protein [Eubacterium sp.]|nr:patatin-like phospholipase family protein [Eubacterium sp.]